MRVEADEASNRNDTRELFNKVKKLNRKSSKTFPSSVNRQNGEPPSSFSDLLEELTEYFKGLLNTNSNLNIEEIPASGYDPNIKTNDFTIEEISKAVKSIETGKSPGNVHNVTPKSFTLDRSNSLNIFGKYSIWSSFLKTHGCSGRKLSSFQSLRSYPRSNFRGISLMSVAVKVFNRVILNRIYDEIISPQLSPFQARFRRRKSCT